MRKVRVSRLHDGRRCIIIIEFIEFLVGNRKLRTTSFDFRIETWRPPIICECESQFFFRFRRSVEQTPVDFNVDFGRKKLYVSECGHCCCHWATCLDGQLHVVCWTKRICHVTSSKALSRLESTSVPPAEDTRLRRCCNNDDRELAWCLCHYKWPDAAAPTSKAPSPSTSDLGSRYPGAVVCYSWIGKVNSKFCTRDASRELLTQVRWKQWRWLNR